MPRTSRKLSSSGIYHIMARGIGKEEIFIATEDFTRFLSCIDKARQKSVFSIYAYCLMPNHIHLLMRPKENDPGKCIQRIITPYAQYFNKQYDRRGHLFQNRFKSETVHDDSYFLTVLRYIHQNPMKAGLVTKPQNYPWSSYQEYEKNHWLIDPKFATGMFQNKWMLLSYLKTPQNDQCLDLDDKQNLKNCDLLRAITSIVNLEKFQNGTPLERREWLREIKTSTHASARQIALVLNISKSTVSRLLSIDTETAKNL